MKSLIAWMVRVIPRAILQKIAPPIAKILGILLRGNTVTCPVNGKSYRKFLPYGRLSSRNNAFCPESMTLERHRLIWLFLKNKTKFFQEKWQVLHIAPEACFIKPFENQHQTGYITADIESPLAKVKMDIHDIPFDKDTFDFCLCNHVLEHVKDDIKALSEIYRILKPNGWAILQVPLFYPLKDKTIQDPTITDPKMREKLFGQSDHVRLYGKDYPVRLASVGFEVEVNQYVKTFSDAEIFRYGLDKKEALYLVHKTA